VQGGTSRSTAVSQSREIGKLHTPNHKIVHTNKKQNKDREAEHIALAVRERRTRRSSPPRLGYARSASQAATGLQWHLRGKAAAPLTVLTCFSSRHRHA
jgi:hypothetical protein